MAKALIVFGWLRDFVIILLFLAGNHVRHTSPLIGIIIMVAAAVVLAERFLWSWYLAEINEPEKETN